MAFHSLNMDRERTERAARLPWVEPEPEPVSSAGDVERSPTERFREWIEAAPTLDGSESLATIIRHLATIWERRDEANVEVFHYVDYKTDLPAELVRLGDHLGIAVTLGHAAELARNASLRVHAVPRR
jgi:hypothetical protein